MSYSFLSDMQIDTLNMYLHSPLEGLPDAVDLLPLCGGGLRYLFFQHGHSDGYGAGCLQPPV